MTDVHPRLQNFLLEKKLPSRSLLLLGPWDLVGGFAAPMRENLAVEEESSGKSIGDNSSD